MDKQEQFRRWLSEPQVKPETAEDRKNRMLLNLLRAEKIAAMKRYEEQEQFLADAYVADGHAKAKEDA